MEGQNDQVGTVQMPAEPAPSSSGVSPELREKVVDALRTVFDPEIPVNIYELGLVYEVNIDTASAVLIRMTLTSPGCPVAGSLPPEVEQKVRNVEGVSASKVELVWEPPWDPSKMSEAAKLQLGMF